MKPDKSRTPDPMRQICTEEEPINHSQPGTVLLLTDPILPWPRSEPIKRPETKYSWKASKYFRE